MFGGYTGLMRISGPKAFEKLRDPMDRLCRVAIAVVTGETDAESEYLDELTALGYEVHPSFDGLIRPRARVLVVPSGSLALRNKLDISDGPDVRIIDAVVIDVNTDSQVVAVRTNVMVPSRPEYRIALFADNSARGRLLTLGTPGGPVTTPSE